MVFAKRGVGKTHVCLGIAFAVATGGRFLKWDTPKPRRTLFVDGEMPASALQERLIALAAPAESEMPSDDYLRLITPDLQERPIPDLATPEGQHVIEPLLEGVELLVLDNLSTLYGPRRSCGRAAGQRKGSVPLGRSRLRSGRRRSRRRS